MKRVLDFLARLFRWSPMVADEPEDAEEFCPLCGSSMEWLRCWNCNGDGFHDDLHEVDPGWYDEDDTKQCDVCEGVGGWLVCGARCQAEGSVCA